MSRTAICKPSRRLKLTRPGCEYHVSLPCTCSTNQRALILRMGSRMTSAIRLPLSDNPIVGALNKTSPSFYSGSSGAAKLPSRACMLSFMIPGQATATGAKRTLFEPLLGPPQLKSCFGHFRGPKNRPERHVCSTFWPACRRSIRKPLLARSKAHGHELMLPVRAPDRHMRKRIAVRSECQYCGCVRKLLMAFNKLLCSA